MDNAVLVWQETVVLPTYQVGEPEKMPVFLDKRVYQGSSGVVYPYAVIEKISDEKVDKEYVALFLENDFLKIMILPELGGRVHRAYDKIRKRDFIYYNQVIKPALVGLTGPWISGGIEFNWPQHHRPSTFLPVDFTIAENEDGSKTVWINEVERMFRTKCQAGFTLYPDKAYLEITGKLYNRSALPQTFLWWANPAVKVNDHYQSVFPPDVHAVFDHGKRDVSDFPIAKGTYYNVNYAPGTDISRYANIPVPTSYMAIQSKYDFMGGYEHDTRAGLLHVANHHVSPGKKQWTWGNGDFGKAWDRNLTDEDGPYIELMTGMFTDNQPDFSWLNPNEEKTFEQYFMPYASVGMVKNATKEALVNLEARDNNIYIGVYVTAQYADCSIVCTAADGKEIKKYHSALSPVEAFEVSFECPTGVDAAGLSVAVLDANGQTLVSYTPELDLDQTLPSAASAAKAPSELSTNESLYLNGLHLEQYRHASYAPTDYYTEALRRDPSDLRCNNAMGLWLMRNGQVKKAVPYFKRAIETLTRRNPNPYDGEAYYNLGTCLMLLGNNEEAYKAFYKASWNDAWQHSSFLQIAKIDLAKGDLHKALNHAEKSLVRNYHSHSARHLKAIILRKLQKHEEALHWINESLKIDPFGYGCLYEGYLSATALKKPEAAQYYAVELTRLARGSANNYIEYAIDYGHAGCFEEAISLLEMYLGQTANAYPMAFYFLGYYAFKSGNKDAAKKWLETAANCSADHCFPNKLEELLVLQFASRENQGDAKAFYYMGNWWYGNKQYDEAIACFERSVTFDSGFATAHRNLALLMYNKRKNNDAALYHLQTAFNLNPNDARVCMELDQLYSKLNRTPAERIAFLEENMPLVESRDDLFLERIMLKNVTGQVGEAQELLLSRKFHPWEGGEGKVVGLFLFTQLMLAMDALQNQNPEDAAIALNATESYPENLGEGKLFGTPENDIHYLLGLANLQMGRDEEAETWFRKATNGNSVPKPALFYNDPQPDKILYKGLAWDKLGETAKAASIFNSMIDYGRRHMHDDVQVDYFAVSLPDILVFNKDLRISNQMHCCYIIGLGELGKGNFEEAASYLHKVLSMDACHLGAIRHLRLIELLKDETESTITEREIVTAI